MSDSPYLPGSIERFSREAAHGVVRLADGRSLPFDVQACRTFLGHSGFFPADGAVVQVRVGLGRTGAERAIEVRDSTPPAGSGPTVGAALGALVEAHLLDAAALSHADPFLLRVHALTPDGARTGRDLLLRLLEGLAAQQHVPGLFSGEAVRHLGALARACGLTAPSVRRLRAQARGFEEETELVSSSTGELALFVPLDTPRAINALLAERNDPRRFVHLVERDAPAWGSGGPQTVWLMDPAQRARFRETVGVPFGLDLVVLGLPSAVTFDAPVADPVLEQVQRGTIDWSSLQHCYGPAIDAPAQLARLRSPEEDDHEDALVGWVYGSLSHQGDVFPATAAALPALLDIVEDPATPNRAGVASAVARIALDSRRHAESTADLHHPACSVLRVLRQLEPRLIALASAGQAPLDGYALVALSALSAELPSAALLQALGASTPRGKLARKLARSTSAIEQHLEKLDDAGS